MSTQTLKTAPDAPEIQQASDPAEIAGFQNGPGLFEREDWTLFRSINTLPQKAGVPLHTLPQLVCKELADNSLDASGGCRVGLLVGENGFYVEDDGPGIPGTDAEVARLFSIRRPLASSKLVRLPTRGALGNGLRVVAGTVLASGGSLTVSTRGRTLRLNPRDDGGTSHEVVGPAPAIGTRVEVRLGEPFRADAADLLLARDAIGMAKAGGESYKGKTSPHWYDADGFWELCQAGGDRTVRELIAEYFDGCSEPAAGKIASAVPRGTLARDLSRPDATQILTAAKGRAKVVNPRKLGCVGPGFLDGWAYSKHMSEWATASKIKAPVVVEVWADPVEADEEADYEVSVNRTRVSADIRAWVIKDGQSRTLILHGCSTQMKIKIGKLPLRVVVNIDTPFMPITTDGKTPDLRGLRDLITDAATKAANKARRWATETARPSQKELIVAAIPGGAARAGEGGR